MQLAQPTLRWERVVNSCGRVQLAIRSSTSILRITCKPLPLLCPFVSRKLLSCSCYYHCVVITMLSAKSYTRFTSNVTQQNSHKYPPAAGALYLPRPFNLMNYKSIFIVRNKFFLRCQCTLFYLCIYHNSAACSEQFSLLHSSTKEASKKKFFDVSFGAVAIPNLLSICQCFCTHSSRTLAATNDGS